jgi:hypothetical protein
MELFKLRLRNYDLLLVLYLLVASGRHAMLHSCTAAEKHFGVTPLRVKKNANVTAFQFVPLPACELMSS